jgi:hypothetical protein
MSSNKFRVSLYAASMLFAGLSRTYGDDVQESYWSWAKGKVFGKNKIDVAEVDTKKELSTEKNALDTLTKNDTLTKEKTSESIQSSIQSLALKTGFEMVATNCGENLGRRIGGTIAENFEKKKMDAACEKGSLLTKMFTMLTYANDAEEAYERGAWIGGIAGHFVGGVAFDVAHITYSTVMEVKEEYNKNNYLDKMAIAKNTAVKVGEATLTRATEASIVDYAKSFAYKFSKNTVKYGIRTYMNPFLGGTTEKTAKFILGDNFVSNALASLSKSSIDIATGNKDLLDPVADKIVDSGIHAVSWVGSKVVVAGSKKAYNITSNAASYAKNSLWNYMNWNKNTENDDDFSQHSFVNKDLDKHILMNCGKHVSAKDHSINEYHLMDHDFDIIASQSI